MTTQTPATGEIEKWPRIRVRFFSNLWLRARQKNAESCRIRLRHSRSGTTSGPELTPAGFCIVFWTWILKEKFLKKRTRIQSHLSFSAVVLRPVAQLYGQVRTDCNQCFVIGCSLSHPAGHKPFTCSLRNMWLNIHAGRWMRFSARPSVHVFTISRNLTWPLFVSSAVSELSSAWSINCFLRYGCCCIVVKDKSRSVLLVDRCCRFASLKPVQNSRQ